MGCCEEDPKRVSTRAFFGFRLLAIHAIFEKIPTLESYGDGPPFFGMVATGEILDRLGD